MTKKFDKKSNPSTGWHKPLDLLPYLTMNEDHEKETVAVWCLLGDGRELGAWWNYHHELGEVWQAWNEPPDGESYDVINWRYMSKKEAKEFEGEFFFDQEN